jgi:LuxR family maltose regulon positive regulatory protein
MMGGVVTTPGSTIVGSIGPDQGPGIITKVLLPRRRADVLSRPRLIDFVNQNLERKLVLVCAPAGYGKTTLLVDFAQQTTVPVCWFTLGPSEADPQVFLEYLIYAIQRRYPDFGQRTLRYLANAGAKDLEVVAGLLIGELHDVADACFVTVFDDFHNVDGQKSIQTLMDLLIPSLPANCCWVIASRTIPQLRLSRLVANRDAAGLGESDLRFTVAEIQQLFTRYYDLLVPESLAIELAQEAEGWIAGIILTSHALWRGLFKGLIQLKGSHGPVFDYLATEVFDHQPAEVQSFLLGSSTLPRLSPTLSDVLLGRDDSRAMLRTLDEGRLFVSRLEGDAEWYRYHPLFQEFLQERLSRDDPALFGRLHRRAGELAEADEDITTAIDHFLAAGDPARAADVCAARADATINAGRSQTLLRWCGRIPPEILATRPDLQISRARAAYDTGDVPLAQSALAVALSASTAMQDRHLIATILIHRSVALRFLGRYQEAIEDCRAGLEIADDLDDKAVQALGYRQLGTLFSVAKSAQEAIPALQRALESYAALNDQHSQGVVCHQLGVTLRRQGLVEAARRILDQAIDHWRALNNVGMLGGTLIVLGNLHYDLGETDDALADLAEARRSAQESGFLRLEGYATESFGDVQRDRGELAAARESYEQGLAIAEKVGDRFLQVATLEGLARAHLYAGETGLAQATLRRARHLADERESVYERALCEDTHGLICLRTDQIEEAVHALDRACAWFETSAGGRDLGRARLHLAQAQLMAGERERSIDLAHAALALLPAGPDDPFLAIEGDYLAAILRVAETGGPAWLPLVIKRLSPTPIERKARPAIGIVPSMTSKRRIRCYTLGRADVEIDGRLLTSGEWKTQTARELWFYLLSHGPVSRDQIIEALWPDSEAAKGQGALYTTVHRVRRALDPDCLERRGDLWNVAPGLRIWTDDQEFEEIAIQFRVTKLEDLTAENLSAAAAAVKLYQGPYLRSLDFSWVDGRRRRLELLYLRLLRTLIDRARESRNFEEVVNYAEVFLQTDPDDEAINEALMRGHAQLGNRSAAVRHYHQYAQQLKVELNTQPSRRLRSLVEQIARDG